MVPTTAGYSSGSTRSATSRSTPTAPAEPGPGDPQRRRRGRAGRPAGPRLLRRRRAPPRRLRRVVARDRAGRDRGAHRAHPPRLGGDGAQLRRPGPRVTSASPPSTPSRTAAPRSSSGAGSFTESFPLFGYDLGDYEELFEEKLDLFAQLLPSRPSPGRAHPRAARPAGVYPTTERGPRAPGSASAAAPSRSSARPATGCRSCSPSSAATAGRFAPFVDLYRRALAELGQPQLPSASTRPGHVADTDEEALERAVAALAGRCATASAPSGLAADSPGRVRRSRPARTARSTSARPRPWPARSPPRSRRSARRAST